jgi:twinkle protein
MEKLALSDAHARWLEDVRKIPCELAAEVGVVSKGSNLGFEYRRNGTILYRKFRVERDGAKSFYIEPKGVELCLWNEDSIREPQPGAPLIITEGEIDALSFLAIGEGHVVSVPNGAAGRPGQGNINPVDDRQFAYLWDGAKLKAGLEGFSRIVLATDGDAPGYVLRDELAIRLGERRCWFVTYPAGTKDANEVLVRHGPEALARLLTDAKPMVPNRLVKFSDIPPEIEGEGYSTGWSELDRHLIIWPATLIVVTGTPGHGKSQWTIVVCANLARIHGLKGAILQFEDNPHRNRSDLLTYAKTWRGNHARYIDCEPVDWIDRMFRTIAPSTSVKAEDDYNLDWVSNAIEEAATRHDCKWVLIDPWNEIEHLWGVNETETAYTVRALKYLKTLARRLRITIFLVTHPTKAGQGKGIAEMTMSDVAGSYAWRAKADIGIIVHRDDEASSLTHIKVNKSKDYMRFGRPGIVRMGYVLTQATYRFVGYGI